jgi:hypothetical protein
VQSYRKPLKRNNAPFAPPPVPSFSLLNTSTSNGQYNSDFGNKVTTESLSPESKKLKPDVAMNSRISGRGHHRNEGRIPSGHSRNGLKKPFGASVVNPRDAANKSLPPAPRRISDESSYNIPAKSHETLNDWSSNRLNRSRGPSTVAATLPGIGSGAEDVPSRNPLMQTSAPIISEIKNPTGVIENPSINARDNWDKDHRRNPARSDPARSEKDERGDWNVRDRSGERRDRFDSSRDSYQHGGRYSDGPGSRGSWNDNGRGPPPDSRFNSRNSSEESRYLYPAGTQIQNRQQSSGHQHNARQINAVPPVQHPSPVQYQPNSTGPHANYPTQFPSTPVGQAYPPQGLPPYQPSVPAQSQYPPPQQLPNTPGHQQTMPGYRQPIPNFQPANSPYPGYQPLPGNVSGNSSSGQIQPHAQPQAYQQPGQPSTYQQPGHYGYPATQPVAPQPVQFQAPPSHMPAYPSQSSWQAPAVGSQQNPMGAPTMAPPQANSNYPNTQPHNYGYSQQPQGYQPGFPPQHQNNPAGSITNTTSVRDMAVPSAEVAGSAQPAQPAAMPPGVSAEEMKEYQKQWEDYKKRWDEYQKQLAEYKQQQEILNGQLAAAANSVPQYQHHIGVPQPVPAPGVMQALPPQYSAQPGVPNAVYQQQHVHQASHMAYPHAPTGFQAPQPMPVPAYHMQQAPYQQQAPGMVPPRYPIGPQ